MRAGARGRRSECGDCDRSDDARSHCVAVCDDADAPVTHVKGCESIGTIPYGLLAPADGLVSWRILPVERSKASRRLVLFGGASQMVAVSRRRRSSSSESQRSRCRSFRSRSSLPGLKISQTWVKWAPGG